MSDFRLGQHEAHIATLLERTARMETDIADIKVMMTERRVERRMALRMGALAGTAVSAVVIPTAKFLFGLMVVSPRP